MFSWQPEAPIWLLGQPLTGAAAKDADPGDEA